jgi:hypothetical protein
MGTVKCTSEFVHKTSFLFVQNPPQGWGRLTSLGIIEIKTRYIGCRICPSNKTKNFLDHYMRRYITRKLLLTGNCNLIVDDNFSTKRMR